MNPMGMNQRSFRVLKEWGILLLLLIALHVLLFIGWALIDPRPGRSLLPVFLLMGLYIASLAVILIVFYRRLNKASVPPEYRYALEHGNITTAKVLEIKQTRWKNRRHRDLKLRNIPTRWEFEMRLLLYREDGSTYEAPLNAFLPSSEIPEKGAIIPVKVHPEHPNIVVWGGKTIV